MLLFVRDVSALFSTLRDGHGVDPETPPHGFSRFSCDRRVVTSSIITTSTNIHTEKRLAATTFFTPVLRPPGSARFRSRAGGSMCQSSGVHRGSAGHVQCRNAEVRCQSERHAFHTLPKYVIFSMWPTLDADDNDNLVFTKLASQLTPDKLGELAVIPIIFVVQTLVSYLCSIGMSRLLGLKKRPRNFVIAMGVRYHHPRKCRLS